MTLTARPREQTPSCTDIYVLIILLIHVFRLVYIILLMNKIKRDLQQITIIHCKIECYVLIIIIVRLLGILFNNS